MHFTSPSTNFLTQGGDALDPCQGLAPGGALKAGLNPTRGFVRFALDVSPSKQFLKVGSLVMTPCTDETCRLSRELVYKNIVKYNSSVEYNKVVSAF